MNLREELRDHNRVVLDVADGFRMNDVMGELADAGGEIISVKKMIPRMNDIFIKLVSENVQK